MNFEKISPYDIIIRHTSNGGCIVQVGCGEFSFSSPEDMLDVMKQFYENPQEMIKNYNEANSDNMTQPDPGYREESCQCEERPNRHIEPPQYDNVIDHGPTRRRSL
jgi:hypothetical protein